MENALMLRKLLAWFAGSLTLSARVASAASLGLFAVPLLCLMWQQRLSAPTADPVSVSTRFPPQSRTEQKLREAHRFWLQAQVAVNEERAVAVEWDPQAAVEIDQSPRWRYRLSRHPDLQRARQAARHAEELARTPEETCRALRLLGLMECYLGQHQAELRTARQLVRIAPTSERSLHWLQRAERCNGLKPARRVAIEHQPRNLEAVGPSGREPF
jgi:hypothetical protein